MWPDDYWSSALNERECTNMWEVGSSAAFNERGTRGVSFEKDGLRVGGRGVIVGKVRGTEGILRRNVVNITRRGGKV